MELVRPERLELPTYWFEAINEPLINNLDGVRQNEAEEYYQSVSMKGIALGITPSVQVVGIPVGIPGRIVMVLLMSPDQQAYRPAPAFSPAAHSPCPQLQAMENSLPALSQ
jgi:hypothetical protein